MIANGNIRKKHYFAALDSYLEDLENAQELYLMTENLRQQYLGSRFCSTPQGKNEVQEIGGELLRIQERINKINESIRQTKVFLSIN